MNNTKQPLPNRRDFIKSSALLGAALAAPAILPSNLFAAGTDTLKVGLIGCGGRGTGAAGQALSADPNVQLTAMADVFQVSLDHSLKTLKKSPEFGDRVTAKPDHCFVGLDAFQKVIDSGVDVVILATPPGFRPQHLKASVAAGKHIFCEKPVATDAPGYRSVMESVAEADKKKLSLVAGFCWRYNLAEQALFQKIHDGAIGDVRVIYGTYYTSVVKPMSPASGRKPNMTDVDWQLRNWYNYVWLSGDSLVEQAIHAVDWMCWAMKDATPLKALAVGGRQVPAPNEGGNIYDHFEVNYEFDNNVRGFIGCRQQDKCERDNTATIYGTNGTARELGFAGVPFIKGDKPWKYDGQRPDMYQIEHNHLFESIRAGKPVNDGVRLANSTMAGIMGRMAAYTGREISWDEAVKSKESLVPENLTWDTKLTVAPMAVPGVTQFV